MGDVKPQVLFEDDWIWVIDKPAGWLMIPGAGPGGQVLSQWVDEKLGKPWIVHRLDAQTSGVCVVARLDISHRFLNLAFSDRRVRKEYDALASGSPALPNAMLKDPIEGKPASTQLRVVERFATTPPSFLARLRPVTGRRHQIRLHLKGLKCPILGDRNYGGLRELSGASIDRVALHAAELELPQASGRKAWPVFKSEWPADFAAWVAKFRGSTT